jgi:hypothetical protein
MNAECGKGMRNAEWGVWNYKAKHTVHATAQDHPELKAAIKAFGQAVQLPLSIL